MLVGGVLNPRCLREINVFIARLVLIVVGVTTRIFLPRFGRIRAAASRSGGDERRAVCLGCGRRHWISTAEHASITRDALAGGSGCGVLRATSTARAAASCSPPAASSGGWSIMQSLTVRHGGKSGALPGLSSGRRSQPDPRTLRGVVLARWGEGNGPHAGRVGYSEGAVWDGFWWERTTAKGTGRGKGTRSTSDSSSQTTRACLFLSSQTHKQTPFEPL